MKRIMMISPTSRDERELARVSGPAVLEGVCCDLCSTATAGGEEAVLHWVGRDPLAEIDDIVRRCRQGGASAVISAADYPGTVVAGLVAERLGLPATRLEAALLCLHNYWSRIVQRETVPEVTPRFWLLDPDGPVDDSAFPLVVRPAAAFFPRVEREVRSRAELWEARETWACAEALSSPLESLLQRYLGSGVGPGRVVAEEPLEGAHALFEGYVFDGEVQPLGVVDAIVTGRNPDPDRFEYPSSLSVNVQERMLGIARRLMPQFGFDHGMLSIKFVYDEDTDALRIVRVRPGMSRELAGLFTRVDGTSPYSVLLALGEGRRPEITRGLGCASMAVAGQQECSSANVRGGRGVHAHARGTRSVNSVRGCGARSRPPGHSGERPRSRVA